MFTANAFVIYFTIGVPFGVLSIYLTNGRVIAIKAAWFAANTALWPVFAARALGTSLFRPPRSTSSSNRLSIQDDLRSRFAAIIPESIRPAESRRLLFEFERLIAFSKAASDSIGDALPTEILLHTIVKHPLPSIAAKCRQRKLLSQLSRHQIDAYLSVNKLIDEQGINLPTAISSELKTLIERNSADILVSDGAQDRLAA